MNETTSPFQKQSPQRTITLLVASLIATGVAFAASGLYLAYG